MLDPLALDGRKAVITGAASGIGRALAHGAAARGLDLVLADVNGDGLHVVGEEVRRLGVQVATLVVDVRSPEQVEALAEQAFADKASVAIVFANAGVTEVMDGLNPDLERWNRVIDINLRGPVHMVKSFLGRMIAAEEPAQFVITGSQASFLAAPSLSPYVATKHAVWGLAETLRMELRQARSSVGISLLAPGRVESALTAASAEKIRQTEGDVAVDRYNAGLLSADDAARLALEGATSRAFWILPAKETHIERFQRRAEELYRAEKLWLQPA